ncbi:thioredoxin domain-containing protein [Chroococcidiopsis sp. CCMEE 29]|uniref:thioredoxin family protein n=1 Tax=Chroococcidiopsis sp. CCMEE 29 TaxID=155894 RepID=UPI002020BC20|nr:thioredoxin domain-containing protein [Chroococcidiopsis sp. CCMEE 29]
MVLSVSERTFTQEVLESPVPVLVNFWAPWCGLCRIIQPLLLEFQTHCNGEVKVVGINADANFKLSNTFRLTTLPTLILIEDGQVRQRLDSFRGRDELRLALEEIRLSYTDGCKTYTEVPTATSLTTDWERRSA